VTNARRGIGAAAVAVLAAAAVIGCGYSMQPLHRTDVKTVAVSIFASKEFRRNLEFDLTGKLARLIPVRTPYTVVHDPKRADTELRGEVISLSAPVLTRDTDINTPQDTEVTVTCWFEWKDLRTGQILSRRDSISGSGIAAAAVGETLTSATDSAMGRLAEKIVEAM
jgi:hypothetical protein